jgi:hypothetical protein
MKKTTRVIALLAVVSLTGLLGINPTSAQSMAERLKGRILLAVQSSGQAWYVNPTNGQRAFLGRPTDAFRIMRELGLGVSEKDFASFSKSAPQKLSGRILLRVGAKGEAYYVHPLDLKLYYLGRPADAFRIMREKGLGITNSDLASIAIDQRYKESATTASTPTASCTKWNPGHYAFISTGSDKKLFSSDPATISDFANLNWDETYLTSFLSGLGKNFKGIEIPVLWRSIEKSENVYDFTMIDTALRAAKASNKQVFLFVLERGYNSSNRPIPDYLYNDNKYGGGGYDFSGNAQIAAIWNSEIQKRFYELIKKLGERYNNNANVEGIIFPESAISISPIPTEFTLENYNAYLKGRVETARQAFPNSQVFQGFNWGGESVITNNAIANKAGFHGPDLIPDAERKIGKKRIPAYDYYPLYAGRIPLASDVQSPQLKPVGDWGNFTLEGIYSMGVDTLKLNYMIWSVFEWGPSYYNFSDIKPFVDSKNGEIKNTACPSAIAPCCAPKPPIVEHFACGDYCPGPREQYLKKVYDGVKDEAACKALGGTPYSYIGWGETKVCLAE